MFKYLKNVKKPKLDGYPTEFFAEASIISGLYIVKFKKLIPEKKKCGLNPSEAQFLYGSL
jgi:hypothetical protein